MAYDFLTTNEQLRNFCRDLADVPEISFDTEFVSEHTYRSQLCLVQVAAAGRLTAVDALAVTDMRPFWEVVAAPGKSVVVHAGREEMGFCLESLGRQPERLFDVQLAAGLVGLEYPAGYGSLLSKLLGKSAMKGETRTDWRRRPLSDKQIDYALDDVRHLFPMRDKLLAKLERLERLSWLEAEMRSWQTDVAESFSRERWRKVTGSSALSPRSLAIVREIWRWRDAEAQRRDWPQRKVLRDDLIVELAKRRSADANQIRAVRGFERRDFREYVPALATAIERALALPDADCPAIVRQDSSAQLTMLGQFLSSALSSICRAAEVAPSLVGTANDVRELVALRLGQYSGNTPPALTVGWRAEVVGHLIDDLIAGKVSIRIADPRSEEPLVFEPLRK